MKTEINSDYNQDLDKTPVQESYNAENIRIQKIGVFLGLAASIFYGSIFNNGSSIQQIKHKSEKEAYTVTPTFQNKSGELRGLPQIIEATTAEEAMQIVAHAMENQASGLEQAAIYVKKGSEQNFRSRTFHVYGSDEGRHKCFGSFESSSYKDACHKAQALVRQTEELGNYTIVNDNYQPIEEMISDGQVFIHTSNIEKSLEDIFKGLPQPKAENEQKVYGRLDDDKEGLVLVIYDDRNDDDDEIGRINIESDGSIKTGAINEMNDRTTIEIPVTNIEAPHNKYAWMTEHYKPSMNPNQITNRMHASEKTKFKMDFGKENQGYSPDLSECRLIVGVSGSVSFHTYSINAEDSGWDVNKLPSFGASVDIEVVCEGNSKEGGEYGVNLGLGKHTGLTITNKRAGLSLGAGYPPYPITPIYKPNQPRELDISSIGTIKNTTIGPVKGEAINEMPDIEKPETQTTESRTPIGSTADGGVIHGPSNALEDHLTGIIEEQTNASSLTNFAPTETSSTNSEPRESYRNDMPNREERVRETPPEPPQRETPTQESPSREQHRESSGSHFSSDKSPGLAERKMG